MPSKAFAFATGNLTSNLVTTGAITAASGNVTGNLVVSGAVTAASANVSGNLAVTGTISMGSSFMRNRIINGDMRIDQRFNGTANNITTSNFYLVDRWAVSAGGATSGTLQAQRIATASPGGPQYCLRLIRSSGTYTSYLIALQVIETLNCYDLAGKTITVSFKARGGSSFISQGGTVNSWVRTGTTADEGMAGSTAGTWTGFNTAGLLGAVSGSAVTSNFQTYSYSVTIPANAQEIAVGIYTSNFTGTGDSNNYLDITDVQLELGSVATPFERRHYGQEFSLCQRYCRVIRAVDAFSYVGPTAYFESASVIQMPCYISGMRNTSTVSATTAGSFANENTGATLTFVGLALKGSDWVRLQWTPSINGTSGQAAMVRTNNDTTAKITIENEL